MLITATHFSYRTQSIMARANRSRTGGGGGRIRPSDCLTDDTTAPIAAGEALQPENAAALLETESKGMKDPCRRDYRNRNSRFIKWLENSAYPQYYQDGTIELSEEDISAPNKYYFKHKRDLVYAGFRVDIFKAFLLSSKVKKIDEDRNEILKSPEDLRKYNGTIKRGAKIAGKWLPTGYWEDMDEFQHSYKKG